jgi:hypothetical protein
MSKTIDITPVGLSTIEGAERVTKAHKAFEESHPEVANLATQFLYANYAELREALANNEDAANALVELRQAMERRDVVMDEFCRAIAGAPPAAARGPIKLSVKRVTE